MDGTTISVLVLRSIRVVVVGLGHPLGTWLGTQLYSDTSQDSYLKTYLGKSFTIQAKGTYILQRKYFFRICQQITSIIVRQSGTARNSFPTEIGCSKPRFIPTYGIILVYRTAKVCSKVELFCTSAVKLNFTAHLQFYKLRLVHMYV